MRLIQLTGPAGRRLAVVDGEQLRLLGPISPSTPWLRLRSWHLCT